MKKLRRLMALFGLCAAIALPAAGQAQAPTPAQVQTKSSPPAQTPVARPRTAPPSTVSVDGNEAMFTTMCALLAAGFESNANSDNWTAFRPQMKKRLRHHPRPPAHPPPEFS